MVAQPDRVETAAEGLLTAAAAALTAANIDVPDRRYITTGQIAADCDQLVVAAVRIFPDAPARETPTAQSQQNAVRTVTFHVERWRCLDLEGGTPTVGSLDATGRMLLTDGWTLDRGIVEAIRDGDIGACRQAEVLFSEAVGPEGAMGGWRTVVDVQML